MNPKTKHDDSYWQLEHDLIRNRLHLYDDSWTTSMMSSPIEQAICHWLARDKFQDKGLLVEVGSFLGGLTRPLVNGIKESNAPGIRKDMIHVYDRFIWTRGMMDWTRDLSGFTPPDVGDDFQGLFERFNPDIGPHTKLIRKDFSVQRVESKPIEILLVDAMKSIDATDNIAKSFLPAMLLNGLLIHQDYLHFGHGWIHLLTWRLRKHLKCLWEAPEQSMVAFEVTSKIPEKLCYVYDRLPPDEPDDILNAYKWNRHLFNGRHEEVLRAAEIFVSIYSGYGKVIAYPKYLEAKRLKMTKSKAFKDMIAFLKFYNTNWPGMGEY